MLSSLVLIVLLLFETPSFGLVRHECIHDKIMKGAVPPTFKGNVHSSSTKAPIRIVIDTTYMNASTDPEYLCTEAGQYRVCVVITEVNCLETWLSYRWDSHQPWNDVC